MRAALAELVRREVFTVSADPLSPERGSYQFAQQMLRQVAYDTLSRRDRKTRHLTVAAHLRAAVPGDGEEVTDVIARHYLDALDAIPDDPDTAEIRGQAIAALIRAAERAERTGAPARAAASYATAAELTWRVRRAAEAADRPPRCVLWERAAARGRHQRDWALAVEPGGPGPGLPPAARPGPGGGPRPGHRRGGSAPVGPTADAREQLTAAVEVLRADPDTDTVHALEQLAVLEVFAGLA